MANGAFVAYYRVSTEEQARSGLGISAQKGAVRSYLNGGHWRLVAECTEFESGRRNDRPKLAEALRLCRIHNATLIVARLDRLARNVAFLSRLMESGIEFAAIDMPSANRMTIHIISAVAEAEALAISQRTKAALASKKIAYAEMTVDQRAELVAKGKAIRLGGKPESLAGQAERGAEASAKVHGHKATARAQDLGAILRELQAAGASLGKIAAELTARQIPAARGGFGWTSTGVKRVLERLAA